MLFEIKSWLNGGILFSLETDSLKLCVEAAVKSKANLRYANLRSADLSYANLRSADLRSADLSYADLRYADLRSANLRSADLSYADLRSAKGLKFFPISISGHKHFLRTTQEGTLKIGCKVKTFEEWAEEAESFGKENGYTALDVEIYKLHIAHIERISKLLWTKKEKASA